MPRVTKKIPKHSLQKQKQNKHVPNIRKDLESFHAFLRSPRSDAEVKKRFKEIFGMKLSEKRLIELLKMKHNNHNQRGGMAPLAYTMGSPDPHLSAVPYVQRGFGFANVDSLTEGSPKEYLGSTPQMGGRRRSAKKQRGGGVADFAASVSAQPFLSSAPLSILQAGARLATGQIGLPSSLPEINRLSIPPPSFVNSAKLVL
jgi:hypothetical protein